MRLTKPLLILFAAAMVAACSGNGSQNNADAGANNSADMTPEGPSLSTKLFGGGKAMPLEVQHKFANGAILYLTSIQAKPTETVVGIRVVNGADRDVSLDWADQKTFLVAGGQKFFLSPPLENKDVKITQGTKMEGELVFLGTLPKDGTVTLVINDGLNDNEYSNTPNASIPIPVTPAAFSDDGSKKN